MKRAMLAVLAVTLAALLEICTGCLRDANGLPVLDLVLIVTLGVAACQGSAAGLLCGLVGGLVLGGPGGAPVSTALV